LLEVKIALIQLAVGADKVENLKRAHQLVLKASKQGAAIVALPVRICIYHLAFFQLTYFF
jgi:hypothetical protein